MAPGDWSCSSRSLPVWGLTFEFVSFCISSTSFLNPRTMLPKTILVFKVLARIGIFLGRLLARSARLRFQRTFHAVSDSSPTIEPEKRKNIVIVGASNAGYIALKSITESLLPNTPYRVVVIEPHDRFHYTWVLPRLCVVTCQA
ncbi:hypothetical protein F5Y18DRAFT_181932 [Xylariaceae sp. FL1019]|nr:hypothetical protein F5Y18DRAFT_181932 [Xylariaceae sp. FL1019]